jgi:hypothetical protein
VLARKTIERTSAGEKYVAEGAGNRVLGDFAQPGRLAIEVLNNRRLVKGHDDGGAWMRRLRQAALLDKQGIALNGAFKTVSKL